MRKNCMKERMVHENGNQDVDGHERCTSRFIIGISDRINFIINNGRGLYFVCLAFRETKLWSCYDYEFIILVYP
jgi:hypothetical protein